MKNEIDFKNILKNTNEYCRVYIFGDNFDNTLFFKKFKNGFTIECNNKYILFIDYNDSKYSTRKLAKHLRNIFRLKGIYDITVSTDICKYRFNVNIDKKLDDNYSSYFYEEMKRYYDKL